MKWMRTGIYQMGGVGPDRRARMQTVKFVHWRDGNWFLGYLLDYPDYWTQGESLDDLKDHLLDLHHEITTGGLPGLRKVDELVIP